MVNRGKMKAHLVLVVLGVLAEVTSACRPLRQTDGIMTVTIEWRFDMWEYRCQAGRKGSEVITSFSRGQRKRIDGLDNDCLLFVCDHRSRTLRLDTKASSCAYKSKCSKSKKYRDSCDEPYNCYNAVFEEAADFVYTDWYRYKHGWFSFFSGYTCGHTGSGPCAANQCFNPFADTKNLSLSTGPTCVEAGDTVVNAETRTFECQRFDSCGSRSFVDLVQTGIVCDNNGTFVTPGTVTWSDACSHTVCEVSGGVGNLVTSFKDKEGCVYGDQCITLGDVTEGRTEFTCAHYKCRKNPELDSPYYFDVTDQGCLYEDKCYKEGQKVTLADSCKRMFCRSDSTGNFYWEQQLRGCYDPTSGQCRPHKAKYSVGQCVANTCVADNQGRWVTDYTKKGSCAPKGGKCTKTNGTPGCRHKGRCYAVNSVLTMGPCVQYVCHSQEQAPNNADAPSPSSNSSSSTSSTPVWKARATGCLGPEGCMSFGEQYVDPYTLNTYRCDFGLGGFGIKRPQFHKACVAPNGQTLGLGRSVLIGTVWYSCYRYGNIRNPIDRAIEFVSEEDEHHTCGINPDTGRTLYKAEYYFTPEGRCKRTGYHCTLDCQYFDQPCTHTDLTPYRYLGDKFMLDGSECVCTQDYDINNVDIPPTGSLFNTPSLCGQPQVRGAACKDPDDGSLHQWGELWERSRGSKVCTCHPLQRRAFCSQSLSDVMQVLEDMKV
ncbi:uncharacterized protein LOC143291535 [Babylonia areolata]|uniref:uncharacterized protein LOC143291535 n=1 Tax=Babylonia areolata TaxID=304850 RepID=UPI003FCF5D96